VVVVSCTAGAVLLLTVECVVVVVVGATTGFSTTVVQDVKRMATAKSGVRMISLFIVGVVFLHWTLRRRCFNQMYFEPRFSKISLG